MSEQYQTQERNNHGLDEAMVERGAKALFPRLMHYTKVTWETCLEEERELIRDDVRAVFLAALGGENDDAD